MKTFLSLLLITSYTIAASAQSTMMDDVSMPYLDKLIQAGKANYPKFKYTEAKSKAARENYNKAKCGILDFITLGYVYFPGNYSIYENNGTTSSPGAYNALNGYQLGVFLNVGSIMQKPAIIKGAKQEYIAAQMDQQVVDLDVEQEIRKRYFTYIQASNVLKLKSKAMTDADDMVQHAKLKFQKGEVSLEVYNQALLSYSTYSQEKISAEASLLVAKTSLEELVGTSLDNIK